MSQPAVAEQATAPPIAATKPGDRRWLRLLLFTATAMACNPTRTSHDRGAQPSADVRTINIRPTVTSQSSPPPEDAEARAARERLVRHIASSQPWGAASWDPRVLEAMQTVPRHRFMPGVGLAMAYRDAPYPIGHQQTISQPSIVALMTNALQLSGDEKVLEIGTGSGYQAAVLAGLCKQLYSIELIPELGEAARLRLTQLGYRNVVVHIGDGYRGLPDRAPFDRIILTAAPDEMPAALVAQLKDGGVIVAPVGGRVQELVRWRKHGGAIQRERLGGVRFVPMVRGESDG